MGWGYLKTLRTDSLVEGLGQNIEKKKKHYVIYVFSSLILLYIEGPLDVYISVYLAVCMYVYCVYYVCQNILTLFVRNTVPMTI